jgi:hypothetical protein
MHSHMIRPDWKPQVHCRVIEQVVDNELVLLDQDREQVYVLNTLAAAIYDLCDGSATVLEIITTLENHLKPSGIDFKHETCRFLSDMLEKEILK